MVGTVTEEGVPVLSLIVGGSHWPAVVDTGFNGDLELPEQLRPLLDVHLIGRMRSQLAGGQSIEEDRYLVNFVFDDEDLIAEATFAPGEEVLMGTHLMRRHRLEIDFAARSVSLERVS